MKPARASTVIVLAQLEPRSGMEVAAVRLLDVLQGRRPTVILFSGAIPAEARELDVRAMGLPRTNRRLIFATLRLRRILRGLPTDSTIVAVGLWAAIPTLLAARGHRVIVWEHSLLGDRVRHDRRVRLLQRLAARYYVRAEAIVAVSEPVRAYLAELAGVPPAICIPNPIGRDEPRTFRRTSGGGRLAVVGNLRAAKNVSLAIRALAHLPPRVELQIAGEGPQRRELEREAVRCGVADRVHFLGRIDRVSALLDTVDLLVHPAWAETFGYVLLEAAQHRTPVVALNRPNMSSLVPRLVPGVLVDDPTERSLADAITDALARDWPDATFDDAANARHRQHDPDSIREMWQLLLDGRAEGGMAQVRPHHTGDSSHEPFRLPSREHSAEAEREGGKTGIAGGSEHAQARDDTGSTSRLQRIPQDLRCDEVDLRPRIRALREGFRPDEGRMPVGLGGDTSVGADGDDTQRLRDLDDTCSLDEGNPDQPVPVAVPSQRGIPRNTKSELPLDEERRQEDGGAPHCRRTTHEQVSRHVAFTRVDLPRNRP
jgi:glycosyltransferase involved in cell wall biosynthesis